MYLRLNGNSKIFQCPNFDRIKFSPFIWAKVYIYLSTIYVHQYLINNKHSKGMIDASNSKNVEHDFDFFLIKIEKNPQKKYSSVVDQCVIIIRLDSHSETKGVD